MVAANILGRHREADYSAIPRCVFTTPSVFAVGAIPGGAEEVTGAGDGDADADHGPDADHGQARTAGHRGPDADHRPGQRGQDAPDAPDREGRRRRRPAAEAASAEARRRRRRPWLRAAPGSGRRAARRLVTARARLGDTARGYLGQDDLGRLELYADAGTGVLAGAVAVGPDAASWMSEVTLAIRAKIPVAVLADVVHAFPTYGEALQTALRELAGTGGSTARADQQEKGTGTLSELDIETPEGDAIEQHQEVIADEAVASPRREVPFDVNEADAAEQERAVGFDDDDYR